jgi:hypothetical protein
MCGEKNEFPIPEVRHPGLAGEVRRQEAIDKASERANVARLGQQGLQLAVGQEDPVELGQVHENADGGQG